MADEQEYEKKQNFDALASRFSEVIKSILEWKIEAKYTIFSSTWEQY
jgi:hypothetical protein